MNYTGCAINKFNQGDRPFQSALRIGQKVLQPEQKIVVSAKKFVDTTKQQYDTDFSREGPVVDDIVFSVKFAVNILLFPTNLVVIAFRHTCRLWFRVLIAMTTNKPNTFLILFFALTSFTMLSPVQIRAEVSLKDTLYRKGNEYCVYIDRDCNSANIKKFIDRINIDRYVSTDIQHQIGKMRDNGIRLFHFDLGHLEGTYIRLRTIGGEKVTTGYMPHITYISDSLIVWHELDSWPYAI